MEKERIEELSFEDTYARLEQVILKLEDGNLSLEESVALYEEGMQLAKQCGRHLDDAEIKVTQLLSAAAEEIDANQFDQDLS